METDWAGERYKRSCDNASENDNEVKSSISGRKLLPRQISNFTLDPEVKRGEGGRSLKPSKKSTLNVLSWPFKPVNIGRASRL